MSDAKITISAEDRTKAVIAGVKASLGDVKNKGDQLNNSFGSLGAVLGAAFAGLSFTAFIKSTAAGIDKLNDIKDATGASIENISALEDIAARTGTSLETVSTSLVKLNQVLNTASPDSVQARALAAIGLSADELRKIDPAEALLKVAQALNGFADDGNKARLVQELFGKSIKEVAPLLNDLAEKGKLVATVTTEQARAAELFNQELARSQKNGLDLARTFVNNLLPAINQTIEAYRNYGGLLGGIKARLGLDDLSQLQKQAELAAAAVTRTGDTVARLAEASARAPDDAFLLTRLQKAQARLLDLKLVAADAAAAIKTAVGVPNSAADYSNEGRNKPRPSVNTPLPRDPKNDALIAAEQKHYEDLAKKLREKIALNEQELRVGRELTEAEKLRIDVESELSSANLQPDHKREIQGLLARAVAESILRQRQAEGIRLTEQATRANANYLQQLDDGSRALRDELTEVGLSTERIEALRTARLEEALARKEQQLATLQLFATNSADYSQMQLIIDALREQIGLRKQIGAKAEGDRRDSFKGAQTAFDEYMLSVERVGDATANAVRTSMSVAEDVLTEFFTKGKLDAGRFAEAVINEIVRISIVKPLISSIGSFFGIGNLLSFAGGGGGSPIPGKATGGDHFGGYRIVGENGPELESTGPSRIYTASQTRDIISGSRSEPGHTFVFNIAAGVQRTEIAAMIPQLKAQIKAELVQSSRRPGYAGGA